MTLPTGKCPKDTKALRAEFARLTKANSGKLISDKFKKDHVYSGQSGQLEKLATKLARLRELANSTLMVSSFAGTAKAEVLNWIENVPDSVFTKVGESWRLANAGGAVTATTQYAFATANPKARNGMNSDDVIKKSRNWLAESKKTPKIACAFADDGTSQIYHLDY